MKRREKKQNRVKHEKPFYPRCVYTGKVSFPSPEATEVSKKIMKAKHGTDGLVAFKCAYCEGYHLGHPKGGEKN